MIRSALLGAVTAALVVVPCTFAQARGFGGGGGGAHFAGGGSRGGFVYHGGDALFGRIPTATSLSNVSRSFYQRPQGIGTRPGEVSRESGMRIGGERIQGIQSRNLGADVTQRGSTGTVAGGGTPPVSAHWQSWQSQSQNHSWYQGHWHGNWDDNWNDGLFNLWSFPWFASPFLGVSGWPFGPSIYNWGYVSYFNPFSVEPVSFGSTVVDFGQPFAQVQYSTSENPAQGPPASADALSEAEEARKAFREQMYERALDEIEGALAKMPGDPALNEYRALVLFALERYRPAAAAIHSMLAVGPGWNWTTMIALYPSADVYTGQLRALEVYRRDHPHAADARFLLAYHYLTCGHTAAAALELRDVLRLVPQDQEAAELLRMITKSSSSAPPDADKPPAKEPQATKDSTASQIDPGSIVGSWTARRNDNSVFHLTITPESRFQWKYQRGDDSRAFGGTSKMQNNVLVLTQDNGQSMAGRVIPASEGTGFRFLLIGGPPGDPGLSFAP